MKQDPPSLLAAPAQIAKAALRRLAAQQLEPTPEHYARAYAQEAGTPVPAAARPDIAAAADWVVLIERLARGLERGSRHWTGARKKQSLQRVLDGSRQDAARLQQRLDRLLAAWDDDSPDREIEPTAPAPLDDAPPETPPPAPSMANAHAPPRSEAPALSAAIDAPVPAASVAATPSVAPGAPAPHRDATRWPAVAADLGGALRAALPASAAALADALGDAARRLALDGPTPALVDEIARLSERARTVLTRNRHLADELATLCRALADGLGELAEDGSWARGQVDALRERLAGTVSARGVRSAGELLRSTRERQHALKRERDAARDALKQMFQRVVVELADLGGHTGRFNDRIAGVAEGISRAESLPSLAGIVQELADETRAVHQAVSGARERLTREHTRATELEQRVRDLESELRRLADEVSTDALTQVANRRGLTQAFDAEAARAAAATDEAPLAIGLIDIDNFKKLNDSLGHAAGDVALKSLAAHVQASLRPVDHVARFGGEEFVVLLPATAVDAAQQVLTRLQRSLSASLFMHEGREVFVTFSAGVTAWRRGETLDNALERADQALYEAKRTGKNRTCSA